MEKLFGSNLSLLTDKEKELCQILIDNGQEHLFSSWDPLGVNDHLKHQFLNQLQQLHESYLPQSGGLIAYIRNARRLLENSMNGVNPLQGWIPTVVSPSMGVSIEPITSEFNTYDQIGLREIESIGFVLVAGGLGERLGFSGIKIALPTETLTNISYIELYCQQILTIQKKYSTPHSRMIPFAIMVSDDTHDKTIELFIQHSYFGLNSNQIYFIKQDKVAALLDNSGRLALNERNIYEINCKPHGHGDVHSILYHTGLAQQWLEQLQVKWLFFFQDTNALALNSLSAMLGVSLEKSLHMNSRAIPRYAKQAVGALVRLIKNKNENKTDSENDSLSLLTTTETMEMTVNVEYNQLEPLLISTISPEGDTNDPITGQSIFPGNINQLLIHLEDYVKVLEQTHGIMNEFVNPKYSDSTRTTFKKPTRLECMMQDYSYALQSSSQTSNWNPRVGYTLSPGWSCYSPVKNHVTDASQAVKKGIPAACALTGEADQYFMWRELLRKIGCDVSEGPLLTLQDISATLSPQVVFHPSFLIFPLELSSRFPSPSHIMISSRSSLVIEGNVIVESLYLDGACKIINKSTTKQLRVRIIKERMVQNEGYQIIPLEGEVGDGGEEKKSDWSEVIRMRGFYLKKIEELLIEFNDETLSSSSPSPFSSSVAEEVVYEL